MPYTQSKINTHIHTIQNCDGGWNDSQRNKAIKYLDNGVTKNKC